MKLDVSKLVLMAEIKFGEELVRSTFIYFILYVGASRT
jgi:hypothetical protein